MCSEASQKYIQQVPQNMYVGSNGLKYNYITSSQSTKQSFTSIQGIVLTFSVLLCIFSCLLTVSLSYKWHMDTNNQIDQLVGTVKEVLRDLNTFADIVRNELVAKHVNNNINKEHKNKNVLIDYDDIDEDYEPDRFMGKELLDNNWPVKNHQANGSHKSKNRQQRSAEIDATNIVKNQLNSSNNAKTNIELIQEGNQDENTLKPYNQRKAKKLGSLRKKTTIEPENEESIEDFIESSEIAAAHFTSDSSNYTTRTHAHYHGNGRLKHPDGDYKDWTQYIWDTNFNNQKSLILKNGKVEVLKPGLYFVYAQIYYSDQHDINGYYIMKNDEKVLGCTTTRHRDTQSDSCYTGGLIYLASKDYLSIKGLDSERFIILNSTKTFFGLFKVSSRDNKK